MAQISRSGRICKKSSRLVDSDDEDKHHRRVRPMTAQEEFIMLQKQLEDKDEESEPISFLADDEEEYYAEEDSLDPSTVEDYYSRENEIVDDDIVEMPEGSQSSDDEQMRISEIQKLISFDASKENVKENKRKSEKGLKKKEQKEQKEQKRNKRSDKGKVRVSAYQVWSQKHRKQLMEQQPDIEFGALNKKLGELWSAVPQAEKFNWQRNARRLQAQKVANQQSEMRREGIKQKAALKAKQLALNSQKAKPVATKSKSEKLKSNRKKKKFNRSAARPQIEKRRSKHLSGHTGITALDTNIKLLDTPPIDVAAHLALLGDSLSIIGARLEEHTGQIAVWGSLSVLLDSLLCALGPLLCLTNSFEDLECLSQTTTSKILNNISYIMPGLH